MSNRLETQISARDKTRRAFASFNSSLDRSRKRMRGLSIALGGFVSIAGAMKLKQITEEAIRFGSQIQLTADKIGVTTESLQALRLAGQEFAGVQSNTLDMALQRFSRRLGEADQGMGELKATLDKYNISTRNADGSVKSVKDALVEYANAVTSAESEQEKLLMAFKAFDSEGAVLKEMLNQGGDALKDFMDRAQSSGAIMSSVMTKEAKKLNAELSLQSQIIKTQLSEAFLGLGGKLIWVTTQVGKLASKINETFTSSRVIFAKEIENLSLPELKEKFEEIKKLRADAEAKGMEKGFIMKALGIGPETATGLMKFDEQLDVVTKKIEDFDEKTTIGKGGQPFLQGLVNGLKSVQTTLPTLAEEGKKFATKFEVGLKSAFDGIIDGTKSVGQSLKDLGKLLLKEALKMLIFRTIIAPFTAGFGGFLEKIGLPGQAMGGSVSKGKPYVVGERGAELFVPGQSGSIIPNHKLGGGGVVINQNINFATGVQATVRNEVLGMLPLISQASVGAVAEARRRGATS